MKKKKKKVKDLYIYINFKLDSWGFEETNINCIKQFN